MARSLCSISCGDPNIIFWRGTGNLRIDDANVPTEFVEKIGNFVGISARVVNVDYGVDFEALRSVGVFGKKVRQLAFLFGREVARLPNALKFSDLFVGFRKCFFRPLISVAWRESAAS